MVPNKLVRADRTETQGLPGLGGLEEVIVSLNSGEARIIGGWGGIYIYMLYALWNEAREEGVSFAQEASYMYQLELVHTYSYIHVMYTYM